MSDTGGLEGVEVYDARESFVLGVTDDGYSIWDRRAPGGPISGFPGTDDGLEAAELEFERLVRDERSRRDRWSPVLRWTLFIALGVWVAASIVHVVLSLLVELNLVGSAGDATGVFRSFEFAAVLQGTSFAVWVAALVVLVALWLRRNGRVVEQRLTGRSPTGQPEEAD